MQTNSTLKKFKIFISKYEIHNCVEKCDLFVGDFTYPSLGLGWEMGTIVEKRKIPSLAVAKKGTIVSRLVTGAECERNPFYSFHYYENIFDILPLVNEKASLVRS